MNSIDLIGQFFPTNSIKFIGYLLRTNQAVNSKKLTRHLLAHIKVVISRAPEPRNNPGFAFLFWEAAEETFAADDLYMKRVSVLK